MYKLLLILKYLRRKLAPMFAAGAVTLCTAMVIIVISVMGGFLTLLQDAARQLTGDVNVVSLSLTGFPHYEELLARLEPLPEVDIATPTIRTFGLLNLAGHTQGVQIRGIVPEQLDRIVGYRDSLLWSTADAMAVVEGRFTPEDMEIPGLRQMYDEQRARWEAIDLEAASMALRAPADWHVGGDRGRPGMVIGVEVNPYQRRDALGRYSFRDAALGSEATLTVVPLTQAGAIQQVGPSNESFTIVNEFKSGLYEVDANVVFVPFDVLQRLLRMEARQVFPDFDPETGEPRGEPVIRPGRVSELVIKGAPGFTLAQVRAAVARETHAWIEDHPEMLPPHVMTWEEVHAGLIGAVRNELGLVTFLFALISLVAVFMVASTFYMIVLEKTRDIGVLRAIGASRLGILGLFVGYGLAVGVLGAALGAALAWLIVTNLNNLQWFLATYLGVTTLLVGALLGGMLIGAVAAVGIGFVEQRMRFWLARLIPAIALLLFVPALASLFVFDDLGPWLNTTIRFVMWDPQTYFFDRIPDQVDPVVVAAVALGAVISSVIGAVVPALIASSLEPVEALRYE
jgi:lipoprotein-releasing system permease protein